ncbi:MAG: ABC transporter substrate-binding protein [Chloroflexi bacterium]|nr:ABC transporter substrate-binding protein [Chloroflexota bacterium]
MWANRCFVISSCLTALALLSASCATKAEPTRQAVQQSGETKSTLPTLKPAPSPSAPATPTPKPASDQPRYGGVLTWAQEADAATFDIHQESGGQHPLTLTPSYNGLLQFDPLSWPDAKIVPDLAESWQISSDGLEYTFRLKTGVKWHDGTAFSSEDVKISLDRVREPPKGVRSPRAAALASVTQVEAAAPNVARMRLKYPSAALSAILATDWLAILPKHIIEAKGDMKRDILGTGPFKFKAYMPGTSLEYSKNGDYFVRGRPYLEGITIYIIRDDSTRFAALRTGRVPYLPHPSGVNATQAQMAQADRNLVVQSTWVPSLSHLRMNLQRAPWSDPRLRRAVSLALDRQAYIKAVMQGAGLIAARMPSKGPWGIPEDELLQMPGYRQPKDADIVEAKRLMAEAGFSQGFETTVLARPERSHQARATFIVAELAKLGIKAAMVVRESAAFDDTLIRGAFDTQAHGPAVAIDDPDLRYGEHYVTGAGRNYGKYSHAKFDDLYDKQSRAVDINERKRLVREMETVLMEDNPDVAIAWQVVMIAHSMRLRNYKIASSAYINNRHQEVWLAG